MASDNSKDKIFPLKRRDWLFGAAGLIGGGMIKTAYDAIIPDDYSPVVLESATSDIATELDDEDFDLPVPDDASKVLGDLPRELGERSQFEQPRRKIMVPYHSGYSTTPLQDLHGIMTPSDLHFERHHGGIPNIDPDKYELLIHGLVEQPMIFTLKDLKRFPAVSKIAFLECSGNGYLTLPSKSSTEEVTAQEVDGLISTSEWTGVSLAMLLKEVGVKPGANWILAEGGDAAVLSRSVPLDKALDDSIIAYGQNGEAIRPEQGYPVRLFLPGYEGSANVKWLRRIEVGDKPFMTREETSKYTDALLNGTSKMFTLQMGPKSIITFPSFPYVLPDKGWWEVRGYAWSGAGKVARVEVSTNGGRSWEAAELQQPILDKCMTRFRYLWNWDGTTTTLMSRTIDEKGAVQLSPKEFFKTQGPGTFYHNNQIRSWRIEGNGLVMFNMA